MPCAPIALFTYNRPDHTKQAVESLLKNKETAESDLFIFSDGPKNEKAIEGVKANRDYIHQIKEQYSSTDLPSSNGDGWRGPFKSITIIEREENWGLANSLIAGITEIVNKYGRVIVVEDDLILSPYFLQFMNEALDKYKDDNRVSAVSGFLNPIDCQAPNTFFLRYFACWGWATWDRAWRLFNPDTKALLKQIRWKTNEFNVGGYGGFYGMLYCQKVGLVDSWAVRFYASSFLAGKFVLFPGVSLTVQTGLDGSGTHSGVCDSSSNSNQLSMSPIPLLDIPINENKEMYAAYSRYYARGRKKYSVKGIYQQFKSFIRRLIGIDYK